MIKYNIINTNTLEVLSQHDSKYEAIITSQKKADELGVEIEIKEVAVADFKHSDLITDINLIANLLRILLEMDIPVYNKPIYQGVLTKCIGEGYSIYDMGKIRKRLGISIFEDCNIFKIVSNTTKASIIFSDNDKFEVKYEF